MVVTAPECKRAASPDAARKALDDRYRDRIRGDPVRDDAQFGGAEAYAAKLRELVLSETQVRQLLARQIYIERYIDYKFRPSVQIKSEDVQNYYQKELLPELAKKNQLNSVGLPAEPAPAPRLADVEGQILELLAQRAISDLAAKWLDDTKSRLKIETTMSDGKS